jgi:small subunit ribosomal protein S20
VTVPHHKSAWKRLRQTDVRRQRNTHIRTRMRGAIKKLREAVGQHDTERAQALLKEAISIIDKTRTKGVIHARTASRKVGRLTRAVSGLSAE